MSQAQPPLSHPHESRAEFTAQALILGTVLTVVMMAANLYLSLKVGMTISASIPASVISMGILRGILKRGTIWENNIVQTMASTGEGMAAAAAFTLPSLIFAGAWTRFEYWESTLIVLLGSILGIVFMVPLRRALIVERKDLVFPEGVACAEVLRAGQRGGKGLAILSAGLGIGAGFKIVQSALGLIYDTVFYATAFGSKAIRIGADMSTAVLAVGFIVRLQISALVFLGGAITWLVGLPLLSDYTGGDVDAYARGLVRDRLRFMGVGAMLVGGLYSIWNVRHSFLAGARAMGRAAGAGSGAHGPETDRDLPFSLLAAILGVTVIGIFFIYAFFLKSAAVAVPTTLVMVVAAFLFVAVAVYIAGLVGSSNSPVSGMTICAVLMAAAVMYVFGIKGQEAILATLAVAIVVCCAASMGGDIAQDLKTGQLIGSTPWKQQAAELISAVVPVFLIPVILNLLNKAYVLGSEEMQAPQANLFASLAKGFFGGGDLEWGMFGVGAGVAIAIVIVDEILKARRSTFRLHVMPVAVGLYLPFTLGVTMLAGGILRYVVDRARGESEDATSTSPGVLFASGLIAGEALLGIGLAIGIVSGAGFLAAPAQMIGWRVGLSLAALAAVGAGLVISGLKKSD